MQVSSHQTIFVIRIDDKSKPKQAPNKILSPFCKLMEQISRPSQLLRDSVNRNKIAANPFDDGQGPIGLLKL